ncbi:MAG: hypothetical protein FK733_15720 [Asgard group archaeon]|nr:hypothetical protein [Asgard group archaeon]
MNQTKPEIDVLKLVFTGIAGFFSFVGLMVYIFSEFGGIYTGYSWNGYFCLTCSYLSGWSKIFLILILFLLLALFGVAIVLVLSNFIPQIPQKIVKPLNIGGIIGAGLNFVLTGLTVLIFHLQVTAEVGTWWWLEAGFYGSLIGSLIAAIFFLLAMIIKPTGKVTA